MGRVYGSSDEDLLAVATLLRGGGVAAIPTETVYGLAANAFDEEACRRIFLIKGRPWIDPLIVHVNGLEAARQVAFLTAEVEAFLARFWPGALTVVVPKRPEVPFLVTAGRATVAVRSPSHPLARRLLELTGCPLAAPSANRFGHLSPTRVEHVLASLGHDWGVVLDGGPCPLGVESTIIDMCDPSQPRLLRPGAIPSVCLEKALGQRLLNGAAQPALDSGEGMPAAGMLERHYSPRLPLQVGRLDECPPWEGADRDRWGRIFWRRPDSFWRGLRHVYWWTEGGQPEEAAPAFYHLLHTAESSGAERIWAEWPPGTGLGEALRDRLRRASGIVG